MQSVVDILRLCNVGVGMYHGGDTELEKKGGGGLTMGHFLGRGDDLGEGWGD